MESETQAAGESRLKDSPRCHSYPDRRSLFSKSVIRHYMVSLVRRPQAIDRRSRASRAPRQRRSRLPCLRQALYHCSFRICTPIRNQAPGASGTKAACRWPIRGP